MKRRILAVGALAWCACSGKPDAAASRPGPAAAEAAPPTSKPELSEEEERAHHVVFADRTSYAYLLLLPDKKRRDPPRRDELVTLVKDEFAPRLHEKEVTLLVKLIETDPETTRNPINVTDPKNLVQTEEEMRRFAESRNSDLLGLYIDVLEIAAEPNNPLIPLRSFADPVLTRELTPQERQSLPHRRFALLLRSEYRNQFGVRGLRLLQTLTLLVSAPRDALIHDWDVGETLNLAAFERRRLKSTLGNVADQIAVVPFPDRRHGKGFVRLSTRGMRRFGSPELELDGLPADVATLQRATHLLYGLVFVVTRHSEVHSSGLAVEADTVLTVAYRDIERAYAGRGASLTRCTGCEEETDVHLVTRTGEPTDPRGHPVVRVVAPRETSSATAYDHRRWVKQALGRVLGP